MAERHIQHVRSKVVDENTGLPKLPGSGSTSPLKYGEIAINYHKGVETVSLRNDADEIVTFHDEVEISSGSPKVQTEIWIDLSDTAVTEVYTKQQIDSQMSGVTNDINSIKAKDQVQDAQIQALSAATEGLDGDFTRTIERIDAKDSEQDGRLDELDRVTSGLDGDFRDKVEQLQSEIDAVSGIAINANEVQIGTASTYAESIEIVIDTQADAETVIYTKEQVDSQISGLTNDINDIKDVNQTQDGRLDAIEQELPNKANNSDLNALNDKVTVISSVTSGMSTETIADIQDELGNKANASDLSALNDTVGQLSSLTETKLSTSVYEAYTASTNDVISGIQSDVEKKLEITDFNTYSAETKEEIDSKADKATFETFSSNTETALGKTFGAVAYDSNSKRINFYNKSTTDNVIGYIDASVFVVDGMVQNVEIKEISGVSYLVVSFNTDAGKNDITIPIDSIFDADNYYTKDETNSVISGAISTLSGIVDGDFTEIIAKVNVVSGKADTNATNISQISGKVDANTANIETISGDVETLSAKTDNLIVIGDSATTLSTDTELFVDTTNGDEDPYQVYTKAQVDAIIAELQRQIDELKG